MPGQDAARPRITAFDWVPPFAQGQVRDLRVRWALEEVGRPYDVTYLSQGEQKGEAHRRRQPFGQVPTFEHDGLTLFESGAIVLHVAQAFAPAGSALLPADPRGRARVMEGCFAALNTVEPPIMDLSNVTIFEAGEPWSQARRPSVEARIDTVLKGLSERLGDRAWLEGDAFSAGDLLMIAVLRIVAGKGLVERHDNLAAYVARGTARPAFRRALADQMAGFTGNPPPGYAEWAARLKTHQGESA